MLKQIGRILDCTLAFSVTQGIVGLWAGVFTLPAFIASHYLGYQLSLIEMWLALYLLFMHQTWRNVVKTLVNVYEQGI